MPPLTQTSLCLKQPIKGVIFDLDGTLVDSILDFAAICAFLGVQHGTDLLEFIKKLPPQARDSALDYIHNQEMLDAHQSTWLPGAQKMMNKLNTASLPTAIVTRNSRAASNIKVQRNEITVDHLISREDAKPKPDPEALLDLCERWGLSPKHCLYVGDYHYDLDAAANAGMRSCLYTGAHTHPSNYQHFSDKADYICDHYDNFFNLLPIIVPTRS